MKNSLKTLALVVLLGLLFTGCGGESNSDVTPISSPGLVKNDAGMISCPVPSPTGDQPTKPGATSTARQKARYVYTSMNISVVCSLWKAAQIATNGDPNFVELVNGVDCHDISHDFAGTTGRSWCLVMDGCPLDGVGGEDCSVTGLNFMALTTSLQRDFGVCSGSGVFLGWVCDA